MFSGLFVDFVCFTLFVLILFVVVFAGFCALDFLIMCLFSCLGYDFVFCLLLVLFYGFTCL